MNIANEKKVNKESESEMIEERGNQEKGVVGSVVKQITYWIGFLIYPYKKKYSLRAVSMSPGDVFQI